MPGALFALEGKRPEATGATSGLGERALAAAPGCGGGGESLACEMAGVCASRREREESHVAAPINKQWNAVHM